MIELRFEFNLEKLVNAIAFFSNAGIADLTKLKVAKLLYFADKAHLLSHGTPIIGDVYWCMDYGPVPSFAMNEMTEVLNKPEIPLGAEADSRVFGKVLRVRRGFLGGHARFVAKAGFAPSVFSATELQALQQTAATYGSKTARQLVDLTHQEPTWTIPNQNRAPGSRAPIPYELFFEGAPVEAQRILARVKAEQCGVAIALAGDVEYAEFGRDLLAYDFGSETDEEDRKSLNHHIARS